MSDEPRHRVLHPFGVNCVDSGWIYIVKCDRRLKIGRTRSPDRRLAAGRTWLPDLEILHVKPFWGITLIERSLHEGLSRCWHAGEWHNIEADCDCQFLIDAFGEFDNDDRDRNSVDWIYWMNSTGFAEFCIEIRRQEKTLPAFRRQETSKLRGQ